MLNSPLPLDSIWFRKSNFFTLVTEVAFAEIIPDNFKEKLQAFENKILENKNDKTNDYGVYYGCMYAGTNSRKSRVTRAEFLKKYVFEL